MMVPAALFAQSNKIITTRITNFEFKPGEKIDSTSSHFIYRMTPDNMKCLVPKQKMNVPNSAALGIKNLSYIPNTIKPQELIPLSKKLSLHQ